MGGSNSKRSAKPLDPLISPLKLRSTSGSEITTGVYRFIFCLLGAIFGTCLLVHSITSWLTPSALPSCTHCHMHAAPAKPSALV